MFAHQVLTTTYLLDYDIELDDALFDAFLMGPNQETLT
jgi:hypothetical protein